jgi:hypothetical protein
MTENETEPMTSLPETQLRVTSSDLIREENGTIIATWELAKIESIRVGRTVNPFSVALIGSACGILYLRWALGLGTWMAILLYFVVAAMGLIGLLMITSPVICFAVAGQGGVRIVCDDSADEVREFVEVIKRQHEEA